MKPVCMFWRHWRTPDSKIHGANMGPIWVLSAPDGPLVGPMNLAIRDNIYWSEMSYLCGSAHSFHAVKACLLSCYETSLPIVLVIDRLHPQSICFPINHYKNFSQSLQRHTLVVAACYIKVQINFQHWWCKVSMILFWNSLKLLRPDGIFMQHGWTGSLLAQLISCGLFASKLLPRPMLLLLWVWPLET